MASSTGVLCGAGFEGPAEAMYLGKKVLVIPMLTQYEQQCNAAGAAAMGATVIKTLDQKYMATIGQWLKEGKPIAVNYPDMTEQIISQIINKHTLSNHRSDKPITNETAYLPA